MISFADRVLSLRSRLGLTQEELAHRLGVAFATVNRWEQGRDVAPQRAKLVAFERLEKESADLNEKTYRAAAQAAIRSYTEKGMILDSLFWGRVVGFYEAALAGKR